MVNRCPYLPKSHVIAYIILKDSYGLRAMVMKASNNFDSGEVH